MKRRYLLVIILIIAIRITGCVHEEKMDLVIESSNNSADTSSTLEVYNASRSENLAFNYIMDDKPMFTLEDIEVYDWKTHTITLDQIYFNAEKSPSWLGGSVIFETDSQDKFMVFVDGELIYEGFYQQSILSSFMPSGAIMRDEADGISITFRKMDESEEDLRGDQRIYECLKSAGVLLDIN